MTPLLRSVSRNLPPHPDRRASAGWHTEPGLAVFEGIRLVYLPPPDQVRGRLYTPELQPAETLWVHVDEPIVNRHFKTLAELDASVARKPKMNFAIQSLSV